MLKTRFGELVLCHLVPIVGIALLVFAPEIWFGWYAGVLCGVCIAPLLLLYGNMWVEAYRDYKEAKRPRPPRSGTR